MLIALLLAFEMLATVVVAIVLYFGRYYVHSTAANDVRNVPWYEVLLLLTGCAAVLGALVIVLKGVLASPSKRNNRLYDPARKLLLALHVGVGLLLLVDATISRYLFWGAIYAAVIVGAGVFLYRATRNTMPMRSLES